MDGCLGVSRQRVLLDASARSGLEVRFPADDVSAHVALHVGYPSGQHRQNTSGLIRVASIAALWGADLPDQAANSLLVNATNLDSYIERPVGAPPGLLVSLSACLSFVKSSAIWFASRRRSYRATM